MRSRPLTHGAYAAVTLLLLTFVTAGAVQASTTLVRAGTRVPRGYDISYPQCGSAYPAKPAFGIVGVNKGLVFSVNPCLASQITWAGGTKAQLYANTGNPGPALSSHWPKGQQTPRVCDAANPDTQACAYDYGWNAAMDSYADAVTAWTSLHLAGSPAGSAWWLDVETSNSWRSNTALNVAELQGEVAGFAAKGVARLGIYSSAYQWGVIAGSSNAFSTHPSWVAGASSLKNAQSRCANTGFTGGPIALVQYPYQGFDGDVAC